MCIITRAVRHRVLKGAPFVFVLLFWGVDFRSYADWLACRHFFLAKKEMWAREVCFAC